MSEFLYSDLNIDRQESPQSRYRGQRVSCVSPLKSSRSMKQAMQLDDNNSSSNNSSNSNISGSSDAMMMGSPVAVTSRSNSARRSAIDDEAFFDEDASLLPFRKIASDLNKSRRSSTGDRFIPSRTDFDVEVANYTLRKSEAFSNATLDTSPAKEEYKKTMGEQLFGVDAQRAVLPLAGSGGIRSLLTKQASAASTSLLAISPMAPFASSPTKQHRTIGRAPVHILDAPEMLEDYYLNLLDWSRTNTVGVALNKAVYLWQASTGSITKLFEVTGQDTSISSLRFTPNGDVLAVGTTEADVQLWDLTTLQRMRTLRGHQGRVSVLAWHDNTLASGSRDSLIHTHDARAAQHITQRLSKHTQEVCGLTYSNDGLLASGGNDNLLCIWDAGRPAPRFAFDHHTAAVKGINFCPWQAGLLASGGGTADRTLRFWDTSTGACLNSIDTKSQVCSVLWSPHYRELVSSHGYSQNQLCVWKYPSMTKVCELTGHSSRVLHMAMSPDGETVASASGDETLRFWRIFERRRSELKTSQAGHDMLALPSITIR